MTKEESARREASSNAELEKELEAWEIQSRAKGFGTSTRVLYDTNFTQVIAKALLIPNSNTEEIHHIDLELRAFRRKRKGDRWEENDTKVSESVNTFSIKSGNGEALRNLTEFLLVLHDHIGKKLSNNRLVIDNISESEVREFLSRLTNDQVEYFNSNTRLQILKSYRDFLNQSLNKNETYIQNWLDEENGKYRKQRCLIFGLEYINHKREGELSRKRFDVLTRSSLSRNEYVIIELKSPCAEVFRVETHETKQGKAEEYHLSPDLARAIPQILRYKSIFSSTSNDSDDLRRMGIEKGDIVKCVIVVGQKKKDDPIWIDHFNSLKSSLSNGLEIITYTELIDKLSITIQNLEYNLTE